MDQRRGDALVQVCRRAVALTPALTATDPEAMLAAARPAGTKATVMVTIGLADLKNRTRPGVLVGGVDAGTLLGPDTVRRLACDAALIPVILDTDRQLLRLGRTRRTFTSAQIRALWLRDRHCTFPGCRAPATWTDAHHLRHWADGGDTDLTNAALLCERHHTIVHRDRLHATLTTTDTTGSTALSTPTPGHGSSGTADPAATTEPSPADPHPDQHHDQSHGMKEPLRLSVFALR